MRPARVHGSERAGRCRAVLHARLRVRAAPYQNEVFSASDVRIGPVAGNHPETYNSVAICDGSIRSVPSAIAARAATAIAGSELPSAVTSVSASTPRTSMLSSSAL